MPLAYALYTYRKNKVFLKGNDEKVTESLDGKLKKNKFKNI